MWGERSLLRSLLLSLGVHAIDMAVSSVGADRLVAASVTTIGTDRLSVNATLRSNDGATAELVIGNYADSFENVIEFVGESSRIRIDNLTTVTSWPLAQPRLGAKAGERLELGGLTGGFDRGGYGPALGHFAAAARREVASVSGLAHSMRILSVVDDLCHAERQDDQ
jgi:predicted dehydrogenase